MPFQPGNTVGKQWKPGESGNPEGKPKGTIHLSTHIQNLLNDDNFELYLEDRLDGWKKFDGPPVKAIVQVALKKAAAGDTKWAEWLAKYGYGQKFEVEHSGEIETGTHNEVLNAEFAEFMKKKTL
jgi:hypothetical protein